MKYRYTLLKQDFTKENLGTYDEEKAFKGANGLYELLGNIRTIELIPEDYYFQSHQINIEFDAPIIAMFGDEEARDNNENKRNPWFDFFNSYDGVYDIVGNVIAVEEVQ